jgi:hypothetical protein
MKIAMTYAAAIALAGDGAHRHPASGAGVSVKGSTVTERT